MRLEWPVVMSEFREMKKLNLIPILVLFCSFSALADSQHDQNWELLAESYVNEMPAFSPVAATGLGDHRFDAELDQVSAQARADEAAFIRRYLAEMANVDRAQLSRANQVD